MGRYPQNPTRWSQAKKGGCGGAKDSFGQITAWRVSAHKGRNSRDPSKLELVWVAPVWVCCSCATGSMKGLARHLVRCCQKLGGKSWKSVCPTTSCQLLHPH